MLALKTAEERIRIWERIHEVTLPRDRRIGWWRSLRPIPGSPVPMCATNIATGRTASRCLVFSRSL